MQCSASQKYKQLYVIIFMPGQSNNEKYNVCVMNKQLGSLQGIYTFKFATAWALSGSIQAGMLLLGSDFTSATNIPVNVSHSCKINSQQCIQQN